VRRIPSPFPQFNRSGIYISISISAVEHRIAECVGWHVTKHYERYTALEPISQGVQNQSGRLPQMDHGSQYLSDHFVKQLQFCGIKPGYAFVEQPQTKGVVERFNRMPQVQAIYGRIFLSWRTWAVRSASSWSITTASGARDKRVSQPSTGSSGTRCNGTTP
jgi:hypothetical protein